MSDLRQQGFRIIAIADEYVAVDPNYWVYKEGLDKGMFVKKADDTVFTGKGWAPVNTFPDYASPKARDWWAGLFKEQLEQGVAVEPNRVKIAICQILVIDSDREGNFLRIEYALSDSRTRGAQIAAFPQSSIWAGEILRLTVWQNRFRAQTANVFRSLQSREASSDARFESGVGHFSDP